MHDLVAYTEPRDRVSSHKAFFLLPEEHLTSVGAYNGDAIVLFDIRPLCDLRVRQSVKDSQTQVFYGANYFVIISSQRHVSAPFSFHSL